MEQETIRLLTEIPGPRSRALMERHRRSISPAMGILHPVFAAEAEDATITDVDGNRFIDFTGGVGCLNVGHANPRVLAAASEQLQRFTHTDYTVVPYPVYIEVAERLLDLSPFPEGRAVFFNSGAEAVENAVKVAKLHTKRSALMAYEGAFHGRTQLALSLTYKSKPYREGLGPFVPGVYRLPYPNAYRGPSVDEALAAIEHAFSYAVSPDDVAAVIIEPVLGEGGFVVAPADYLRELRAICDQHDIMLVVDEVQTGFGRTGRMFAVEHAGIVPDLMTLAKSLAGGLPLSAVLGKAAVMDSAPDGSLGGTFVGNPVALAAANGVLDTFESDDLLARGQRVGEQVRTRMESWGERFPAIGDVRGLGAMLAIELVADRVTKTPAPELAIKVIDEARARGLLLLRAGVYSNCVRVLVPLTVSDNVLSEALDVFAAALAAALDESSRERGSATSASLAV